MGHRLEAIYPVRTFHTEVQKQVELGLLNPFTFHVCFPFIRYLLFYAFGIVNFNESKYFRNCSTEMRTNLERN